MTVGTWYDTTDASVWASAFMEVVEGGAPVGEDLMIGWFANAMQRGVLWNDRLHVTPLNKELNSLSDQLKRHVEMYSEMPMRASEMTERERALFQMLAADRGMLKFLQTHLRELAKRNVDLDIKD